MLSKRAKIICFFGPDGVGKSTIIKMLRIFMKNKRIIVLKIGTNHFPARLAEKVFISLGYYIWRPNSICKMQKRIPKELLNTNAFIRVLWALSNFIGSTVMIAYSFIASKYVDAVLLEDYIPRIIADYVYALERHLSKYRLFLKTFIAFLTRLRPILIYLAVNSYKVLQERRGVCVEPYDYIYIQTLVYKILCKYFCGYLNVNIIDTSKHDVNQTFKNILKIVDLEKV